MSKKYVAHPLIAKTAGEMAGALYEAKMLNNAWFTTWKADNPRLNAKGLERVFIKTFAPMLLEHARATLAEMLNGPIEDDLKTRIADALIKDNALRSNGKRLTVH